MKSLRTDFLFPTLLLLLILCSCVQGKVCTYEKHLPELPVDSVSVNASVLGIPKNGIINIIDTIDLNHRVCTIPAGLTLNFKDGVIKNGTLVGNMTQIKSRNACFHRIRIQGTWNVPEIKSSLFCDLRYDNSLKDVFALSHPSVSNKIYVAEGNYQVTAKKQSDACITVYSNSDVVLNGTIKLTPNKYPSYDIFKVQGDKISISGMGTIIGDKYTHTGKKGEWGMGIEVGRSRKVTITGLTIKKCWGDCIYVGNESRNVTISNCYLDNGRRQGISITSANDVKIRDCVISNVAGTDPQYAIDIEPNSGKTVTNVSIRNVRSKNCVGGFVVSGIAKNTKIRNIIFSNCSVIGASNKYPMALLKAEDVTLENCDIDSNSDYSMLIQEVAILKARNNIFRAKGNKHLNKIHSKDLKIENNQFIIK